MGALTKELSFLPGYEVIRHGPDDCALVGPHGNVKLDWSNGPLYELYSAGAIHISEETICQYVRFFFDNVRAQDDWQFFIVEPWDVIPWDDDVSEVLKQKIVKRFFPMRFIGEDHQKLLTLAASVIFQNALFHCEIKLSPGCLDIIDRVGNYQFFCPGQLAMWNERMVIENLPIASERWNRGVIR